MPRAPHHPSEPAPAPPRDATAVLNEAINAVLNGAQSPLDPLPAAAPATKRPNALRTVVVSNSPFLAPWRWMVAADITAVTAHYATPSLWWAALTAAGASSAAAGWAAWRCREARLTQRIKTARTRHRVRSNAKTAVGAGSAWMMTAAMWTPVGPTVGPVPATMQFLLLGGGMVIAAPHWYRNRRRDTPLEPAAEIEAPAEDPRLGRFRDHFCVQGNLEGADLHSFEQVTGGFRFQILLPLARRVTFNHVKQLEDEIAALYDVPYDHVSVEHDETRSARRAVVTVLTATRAHERDELWDGQSTYDPATGCCQLGRYADSDPSRWQLHVPGSGACSGVVIGSQGSGKTGTLNVIACEHGLAKLCTDCGAEHACPECDRQRIAAIWMGDPQRQGLAVWKGRADLTAWGPVSCVRMLSWMHASMRHRADFFGRMEWTDHLGRRNVGKGWFDPSPQFPKITGIIDEWPVLSDDPDLGPLAIAFALGILAEGRKVGHDLVIASTGSDVDVLGDRGVRNLLKSFNALSHRSDRYAKRMLGLEGNPEDLPEGVHGVSYLKSLDQRSGIVQRTKHLPEILRPGQHGVDVRAIADRIAADPITYDEAVMRALRPLGYTGQGQVLDDELDDWNISALVPADEASAADEPTEPGASPAAAAAPYMGAVSKALTATNGGDVFDLMQATGLSALEVHKALVALVDRGHATQSSDGAYAPTTEGVR